ncbi:hypothetical protein SMITH_209 [Smithella sp. ME-1]|nr:hypothetical protein SMITH_209 [Smithella sp. ME-1]
MHRVNYRRTGDSFFRDIHVMAGCTITLKGTNPARLTALG